MISDLGEGAIVDLSWLPSVGNQLILNDSKLIYLFYVVRLHRCSTSQREPCPTKLSTISMRANILPLIQNPDARAGHCRSEGGSSTRWCAVGARQQLHSSAASCSAPWPRRRTLSASSSAAVSGNVAGLARFRPCRRRAWQQSSR